MALVLLSTGVLLNSCKKETTAPPLVPTNSTSGYSDENGKYRKEITVTDESGKNTLFLAISSDNQAAVDQYLKTTQLKLIIEKDNYIATIKQNASEKRIANPNDNMDKPDIDEKSMVTIEVITSNFETNVKGYSLDVKTIPDHSQRFKSGGQRGQYWSNSDFCGVVHLGMGYDIYCVVGWQPFPAAPWHDWASAFLSANTSDPSKYAGYVYKPGSYRTNAIVYLDLQQGSVINYKVVFSQNDYRGKHCSIGTYDTQNCYYGTAPSGTSAFIWTNNFYYTPVNGNQCPRPGSGFDGANCWVATFPSGCIPFTWNNSWYIKGDLLPL